MIEIFKSEDGKLTVEKSSGANAGIALASETKATKAISVDSLLDTVFSFEREDLNLATTGNQKCAFCGKDTGYGNRYVCYDCWESNQHRILRDLKQIGNDEQIYFEF